MGLVPQMIDGRRITDAAMLEVVCHDLCWSINKKYRCTITINSTNAIGFGLTEFNSIRQNVYNKLWFCR
jgi:acetylglutamate kinase